MPRRQTETAAENVLKTGDFSDVFEIADDGDGVITGYIHMDLNTHQMESIFWSWAAFIERFEASIVVNKAYGRNSFRMGVNARLNMFDAQNPHTRKGSLK